MLRVRLLEVCDLAVEVRALLGAADTGVDVAALGCFGSENSEQSIDTTDVIESLASWGAEMIEPSGGRPAAKCGC